ncbi:MAG TPA: hypothetical protein VGL86_14550 [Polyangia bacterium]
MIALGLGAACQPIVDRCRAGTLLIAVSLDTAAAAADSFTVDVALDGGPPQEATLAHVPGQVAGNVEVQFPHGYPTGSVVSVSVTALAGGSVVGAGSASATLSAGCQSTTLAVSAANVDGGAGDLPAPLDGGDDLAPPGDLAPPPDLRPPPPDLYCPGGGVELCFNGIDDDCDGLADCADPDCFPVAKCVPAATTGWSYLTQEPASGACPTGSSGAPAYGNTDLTGGGCASSCACTPGGCSATLTGESCPDDTLNGDNRPVGNGPGCENIVDYISFNVGAISGSATCGGSGSAAPVSPPAIPTMLDCNPTTAPVVGVAGGCTATQACVPIGTHQCVAMAGENQVCPSPYSGGANWFPSFSDGRSCACSCSAIGSCASAQVDLFDSKQCIGTPHAISGLECENGLQGAKIVNSGCAPSATLSGQLGFNAAMAHTVCCQ